MNEKVFFIMGMRADAIITQVAIAVVKRRIIILNNLEMKFFLFFQLTIYYFLVI
ncbi:MAG: hypothetical protein NG747_07515 [Candidatus Brocadia sp.]|nr:hypothetical protein [Candidatus Brocadia sp.]